jgi:hypothetical protein
MKLSTTIGKILNIPNHMNIEIINEFLDCMKKKGSSEHHQNNNLKLAIEFSNFLGRDSSFYHVKNKGIGFRIFMNSESKNRVSCN